MKRIAALAALLVLVAGCGISPRHRRPRTAAPSQASIPEQEEFELHLERTGGLIDAILAIDRLVEPDTDVAGAR